MRPRANTVTLLCVLLVAGPIAFAPIARASITLVSGEVSGVWSADSILVSGDIFVAAGNTLVIQPGVEVLFLDSFRFDIGNGALLQAVGTASEPIRFACLLETHRFVAIFFDSPSAETRLEYCEVTDGLWGALRLEDADITIRHCRFEDNIASPGSLGGGAVAAMNGSDVLIESCVFENNEAGDEGGAVFCDASAATIRDNVFAGNRCGDGGSASGGAIWCGNNSWAEISGNSFQANVVHASEIFSPASGQGGAFYCGDGSHATIAHNEFLDNRVEGATSGAFQGGGAIFVSSANPEITNNLFAGNLSQGHDGGAIFVFNSNTQIINNTFANNQASDNGGALYFRFAGQPLVTNCILFLNEADSGAQISVQDANPTVTYCDVQGGWPGTGNIDVDPLFRDPSTRDYHLQDSQSCGDPGFSPCIDVGNPEYVDAILDCDWGLGTVLSDMGAYGGGASAQSAVRATPDGIARGLSFSLQPNPMGDRVALRYVLQRPIDVRLSLHDITGREIRSLTAGIESAGMHEVVLECGGLPTGVYWARLEAGTRHASRQVILRR